MKPQHRHVEISSRRRALFPPDDNSRDSDLGCISPLNSDDAYLKTPVFSLTRCVGDYDIIGLVDKSAPVNTPKSTSKPCTAAIVTPHHVTITDDSPTQKLKTPHDTTSTTKISLPKLTRKADTTLTHSQSDTITDFNKCKVRTALFPEMPLPPKTFYPAVTSPTCVTRQFSVTESKPRKKCVKKRKLYLCNRQSRFNGKINAGVGHKVKKITRFKSKNLKKRVKSMVNHSFNTESAAQEVEKENITDSPDHRQPSPEPQFDPSKKFFKSSQRKAVIKVHQNIKLEVNNGKITLPQDKRNLKRPREQEVTCSKKIKLNHEFDAIDEPTVDISNIITSLEAPETGILMSPTSQMCNMTSDLALNSPKKKNLNQALDTVAECSDKRLFPIFYPTKTPPPRSKPEDTLKNCSNAKRFKALPKDQMLLDAGQKRFGVTQCAECQIVYHMGDPGDEIMHQNYHSATHIFKFHGWKNERMVHADTAQQSRIIKIMPTDSKIWWKKVKDVMEVINRDLGFYDMEFNTAHSQIFLYIHNKTIIGVLAAETKTTAYKLLTTSENEVDLCSEAPYPIKCGVSRIWVSQNHRKKGVATALMESLKRNFMFGYVLSNEDIAFSSPTEMGKTFGKIYFKTSNFLIYFV